MSMKIFNLKFLFTYINYLFVFMKNTLSIFEIKNKNILISGACEIGNDIIKFLHDGGKIFAFDNNKLNLKNLRINPNINYFLQ